MAQENREPPTVKTMVYKVVDGLDIRADVYAPDGQAPGPAILYIHGGALIFGNRHWIQPYQLERYVGAGFTVVSIDYRLAPEAKLPNIIEDVEDAYSWMRRDGAAEFGIDPDRVSLVGYSAGAYLSLVAGYRFAPRPRAVVSFYGYGDLTGPWYSEPSPFYLETEERVSEEVARAGVGTAPISEGPLLLVSPRSAFYVHCRQRGMWPLEVAGHKPTETDWFRPHEPLRNVSSDFPPTLLLHGEMDTDVPFQQSVLMSEEFARHGVTHELVSGRDWNHAFDFKDPGAPEIIKAIDKAADFLVQHGR